jgi:uncharacterized membrane protein YoaK (UPF0700 family)/anti-anti-sigma regulatory factor
VFLSAAHSFKQQARLAITLAWVAGYTNIVALLSCGTVTSHMTGAASNLGRGVAERDWSLAGFELFLLGAFVCGAVLAGIATELGRRRAWQSIYVLPMAIEALLLAGFAVGLEVIMHASQASAFSQGAQPTLPMIDAKHSPVAAYALLACAAAAMGLQNATITRISSGVVRTTHVTGVLTDIGLELVQTVEAMWDALRKRRRAAGDGNAATVATPMLAAIRIDPHARRLALLASIVGSFVLGAALGVLVFERVSSNWAMFPPVLFLAWIIAQDLRKPIAEIEPSELVVRAGLDLPDWLGVYHLTGVSARRGSGGGVSLGEHGAKHAAQVASSVQRLPDLVAWLERVPEHVRVIVLDLTDVAALEEDAGLQLRAAILALREQGKRLIVAGVTNEQYRQLRRAGTGDVLDPASVCPDLELAIARAIT